MKKGLTHFRGLYGDTQEVTLADFLHHELLETRSKMYDWEIKEHLHTELFQLFLIEKGEGVVRSESKEMPIESPALVLVPANTLHGFTFQPDMIGEVITFSESFIEGLFKQSPKVLLEVGQFRLLSFKDNEWMFVKIKHFIKDILHESIEEQAEKQAVIQLYFQLLFFNIYRYSIDKQEVVATIDNRTLHYFQAFQKSVKRSITEIKSVGQYAHELGITGVHLNRICQSLVQKSALAVVHDYLTIEAKKYLLNTDYTIAEVAYLLNFSEPAYFTKFFRKQTGVSPSEFRKN